MFRIDEVLGIDPGTKTDLSVPLVERYYGAYLRGVVGDEGEVVEDFPYGIVPSDRGANANAVRLAVQAWLDAGNVFPSYVPPTPEELREQMPPLTSRQFRLGLLHSGTIEDDVAAIIAQISDPTERSVADIEWRMADTFERTHPLVTQLGSALGYAPEVIDDLWTFYLTI